jgi:adenine-specific DNA-methyltransferase
MGPNIERQTALFADFEPDNLDVFEQVEFYKHEVPWANRLILGDQLLVMTSLAEKERLKGQVQTIYIDPPYGIKFNSNWQVSTRKRDVKDGRTAGDPSDFVHLILENLRKAGVQNTVRQERLMFDRLEPHAGVWLQATGEYTERPADGEGEGMVRRVAVCVGPEHGTVGPELVRDAAREASRGLGYDLLVVCGFAFDPHVGEEARRYGALTVLPARMNADLAMGGVLKTTGAGNLFTVFGEPDIAIEPGTDETLTVTIHGVDVYDPTTGEVRSRSTDEIACWFVDTAYDEERFVVRHAYFTGAEQPYEKLRKALARHDTIDEEAWASLYRTTSRPFPRPGGGKIAVKVINHYGDEVLKVYDV